METQPGPMKGFVDEKTGARGKRICQVHSHCTRRDEGHCSPCPVPQALPLGEKEGPEKASVKPQHPQPPKKENSVASQRPEGRQGRKLSGSVSTTHAKSPGGCKQEASAEKRSSCQPRHRHVAVPRTSEGPITCLKVPPRPQEGCPKMK